MEIKEKLEEILTAFCQQHGKEFSVTVEDAPYGVRAIVVLDTFEREADRQWKVWAHVKSVLNGDVCRIGCIQTLAPGEAPYAWND